MIHLFDEENGLLLLDEVVMQSPRYQAIVADALVTDDEVIEQAGRVVELFRKINCQLSEEDKALVVKAIAELAVLYQIDAIKEGKKHGNL